MSPWRCPHCGTPQAESARCWACSRSPLTCSTCRHFRRSIAGRLGYCAADRARPVLTGDEIRACWQAPERGEPYAGLFDGLATSARPAASATPAATPAASPASRALPDPRGIGHGRAAQAPDAAPETHPASAHPASAATPPPIRWRHPIDAARTGVALRTTDVSDPATPADAADVPERRTVGVTLLPVGLANRLRRGLGVRGSRDPAVDAAAAPEGPAPEGPRPAAGVRATARPVTGRLVEARSVPPTGTISSLADQLRRAEAIRRERASLDVQGDGLGRGGETLR